MRCKQFDSKVCAYGDTWPDSALETQADIYSKFVQLCLDEPNCMNFETWGFTDKYSSLDSTQKGLPFDKDMKAKLAHTKMVQTLQAYDKTSAIAQAKLAAGNGEPLTSTTFLTK